MAWGAAARVTGKVAARQMAKAAVRNAARAGARSVANQARTVARQGLRNTGRQLYRSAANTRAGRGLGRAATSASRFGAKMRPYMSDAVQYSQVAAGMAPYILDATRGTPAAGLGEGAAKIARDDTAYDVGGVKLTRKEIMAELAKAEKALAAMNTTSK